MKPQKFFKIVRNLLQRMVDVYWWEGIPEAWKSVEI